MLTKLNTNYNDHILQLGGVPPHFHIRVLLNRVLRQRWIGCAANGDNNFLPWPPHSPDLNHAIYFLRGFIKSSVYAPPLPTPIQELRDQITRALQTFTLDMLRRVWDEFNGEAHIEHIEAR